MWRYVKAGELEIWTEQVGDGPDVLLIGGRGTRSSLGSSSWTGWRTATG
ncbi:hypothetical protein J2X01_003472 [Arthrobacter ginsengisoli]|uniref:Uncharacterized protein n=1 Tax=Arthrobacter ginsengisoli TaxID=1356565 RepID=A0ABU1UG49_9MICC|nr:hypothetical protein [Arthrobacter ginsengisoli]